MQPSLSLFSAAGWSEGAPHPIVPLWLPFSPIDLTQGPATPRETGTLRHTVPFVEGTHQFRLTADSADKKYAPLLPVLSTADMLFKMCNL